MHSLLVVVLSYIIGSISWSYLLVKIFTDNDIRNFGSNNAGTTNTVRCFGKTLGISVFILDALKGVLSYYLCSIIDPLYGKYISIVFTVVGHNWPFYLRFKGGKGIATSIGMLATINIYICILSLLAGGIVLLFSKYISACSLTIISVAPFIYLCMYNNDKYTFISLLIIALFGFIRHKDNIGRILNGSERKIRI